MYGFKYNFGYGRVGSVYRPYINYSWSSTYQAQEYKTDGVELVTNGDFSDGLTSYDLDVDGGTPSIVDERLYIVSNGDGFTGIKQPGLPLVNTDVLKVEVSLEIITGTEIRIQLGSDVLIVPAPDGISTYYSSGFAGTPRISVLTTGIDEFYVNYVSIQKVIEEPNKMYTKNLGTGTPLALYSGQGLKNNGIDHDLDLVDIGATSMIYTLDGVQTYTETPFYSFLGLGGVWNDIYYFNRALTQSEITKYSTNPNQFFNDARLDNTCVLNMPLAENDKYCYDYANYSETLIFEDSTTKTLDANNTLVVYDNHIYQDGLYEVTLSNIVGDAIIKIGSTRYYPYLGVSTIMLSDNSISEDRIIVKAQTSGATVIYDAISVKQLSGVHEVSNYTDSVRDEAKQLSYGSQNANYKINNLGMRTDESINYEADGIGKAIIPSHTDNVNINLVVNPTELTGNILSGGITLDTTGLIVGVDNSIELLNQTPTGAITLADGFKGTIKTYTEDLV